MFDHSSDKPTSHPIEADAWINALLLGMRLSGLHYRRIEMTPPFGTRFPSTTPCAHFHFVAQGAVVLRLADGESHTLAAGDAVFLPRGGAHELLSSPDVESLCIDDIRSAPVCEAVTCVNACAQACDEAASIRIFSGCMTLDLGGMQPLVSLMPAVMPVATLLSIYPELPGLLEAMARESRLERAGAGAILARMADVVAASIIRGWIEGAKHDSSGWLVALRDPRLGRVLVALHQAPGEPWSIARMAGVASYSRSVFADRFTRIVGIAPSAYLTQLRMRLAQQWIGERSDPIEKIAWKLGYGSQAAFTRAYKRATGTTPAASRDAHPGLSV